MNPAVCQIDFARGENGVLHRNSLARLLSLVAYRNRRLVGRDRAAETTKYTQQHSRKLDFHEKKCHARSNQMLASRALHAHKSFKPAADSRMQSLINNSTLAAVRTLTAWKPVGLKHSHDSLKECIHLVEWRV